MVQYVCEGHAASSSPEGQSAIPSQYMLHPISIPLLQVNVPVGIYLQFPTKREKYIKDTVNQLNFAAVKFGVLAIFLYFAHFNFAFLYLRIFPDKNVASQKCL